MIDYTHKVGETDACKKIIEFVESQSVIKQAIEKKYSENEMDKYRI